MTNQKELEKLNQEIRSCKKCPLGKLRKNTVSGEGPERAKIMIIGQAPGVEEDRKGKPFCGRAGKFLDNLLKLARTERKEIFITSVLKCLPQPPINRKLKKEEIKACLPYLERQIEIGGPKKFILLGNVAFLVFFPDKKLKDFRGRWVKTKEREYFPTYHPAAGLRFPKVRKILERDFLKIKKSIRDF